MDGQLSRRERKKMETRQRLLKASLDLFREKGYSATTLEEITDRADVAKGTFFNYFPSKESLLSDLSNRGLRELREKLDVENGAPASPVARIKLLFYLLQERHRHDMRLACRAFATHLAHPPTAPATIRQQLSDIFRNLVKEAQNCGEIRSDVDSELVSELLQISYFRCMVAYQDEAHARFSTERIEGMFNIWMDGLAGPEWKRS